jgi:D-sedoheptulose 7-phosphate isomerase
MSSSRTPSETFVENLEESLSLKRAILADRELIATVAEVAEELVRALESGGKVLLFGNGGSAADAQHLAAEFVGRFERDRRALPAIALTTDTSALTAIGNDYSFEEIFARQVRALASPGDVAIGMSTSGSSLNVLQGVRAAKEAGAFTVGFTGMHGGALMSCAHRSICIPSNRTSRIQEAHMLVGHALCEFVEIKLFSDSQASTLARVGSPSTAVGIE